MGFFRRILSGKKEKELSEEVPSPSIHIKGTLLFYDERGETEQVDLNNLQYAYVLVLGENPYLFLFDHRQHFISAQLNNFEVVYASISKRFGFDDAIFFQHIGRQQEAKERIWLNKKAANYSFLPDHYTDFMEGFEVQSPLKLFISWDTTYEELLTKQVGELTINDFETSVFKFDYPVRMGRLLINELFIYWDNNRKDVPIQHYTVDLYDSTNTDRSYTEIRDEWLVDSPMNLDENGYEREDQKYLTFTFGEISLSICYTYDVEWAFDSGSTSLSIENRREYTDLYTLNERYVMDSNRRLIFNTSYEIIEDYRKNRHVKENPVKINRSLQQKNSLWIDKINGVMGFSGIEKALIYPIENVEKISFYNTQPAKGGGYSYFSVHLKEAHFEEHVFCGECFEFDSYAEAIALLTGIKVNIPEADFNC